MVTTLPKPALRPNSSQSANTRDREGPSNLQAEIQTQIHRQVTGHGAEFDELFNEYADLFTGKCTPMAGANYHIELEPGATPINYGSVRNVPEPNKAKLKLELDSLVTQGIIEKIDYPTP